jgi:hypothetical protein
VNASQYLQKFHACLASVVDKNTVAKRYDFILNQIVGSQVAQTSSCWLSYPVLETGKKYHTVLATDEYFTYTTQAQQQQLIETVIAATEQRLIVTVRDFKNSNRYELGNNFSINQPDQSIIITENTRSDGSEDRQAWQHDTYIITHAQDIKLQHVGTVNRRAVYFKQMAKFCFDAGCTSFRVIPNILFKPIFKSHVEHVVVVDW